ncbi:hypothetical protein EDD66_10492 [Mobilisporobacter senegalensis]|uniref:Transglutaminase superfamily protein n=1 Tax=Mobilisporobacter senegalensis TaxID=1329262 RepID=A0A3N1XP90_9FIRM|nr:hypothetical protein [Mobilisporobacter senegalensis]ROR28510.1 hypothetical protein EDD66_10492 [Mobilisporobacter senegalensis]
MDNLIRICLQFRKAIEKTNKNELLISFKNFPLGSCGDTSLILGSYLHSKGYGVYNYICGERGEQSHAWLEKDGLIIDITSDQFGKENSSVYVGLINDFYSEFEVEFSHPYYESLDGNSIDTDTLYNDYIKICANL